MKNIATDLLVGLLVGLLAVGALVHANPVTLNEATYAQALRLSQGTPQGAAEQFSRLAFGLLGPLLGWGAHPQGMISYYLIFPPLLAILASLLAYAALRLWKFERLESALISILLMLSLPVLLAFYPGLMPPEAMALPCALLGLFALAWSARDGKNEWEHVSLVVSLAGFSLAVWMAPALALIPLSLLLASVAEAYPNFASLIGGAWERQARLLVLLAPLLLLFAVPWPTLVFSTARMMAFLGWARYLAPLAAVSIGLWLSARATHPQAPFFAALALAGLLAGVMSPAAGLLILLLPAAYGWRALGGLNGWTVPSKALGVALLVILLSVGLFSLENEPLRAAGQAVLVAGAVLAILLVYNWPAPLTQGGVAVFLFSAAVLAGVQNTPDDSGSPYGYHPLPLSVQRALIWIGQQPGEHRVATFAPSEAVKLLANGRKVSDDDTFTRWLAGANNSGQALLQPGDYVVVVPELFYEIKAREDVLERPWSLVAFRLLGLARDANGAQYAAYDAPADNYRLRQPLDRDDRLTSEAGELTTRSTNLFVGPLQPGAAMLLYPDHPLTEEGNLLLWFGKEYKSNVLGLFRSEILYSEEYRNGSMRVRKVVIGG